MIQLKSNVYNFGTVGKDDVLEFEMPFEGDPDDIHYVMGGCPSCTDAWVEGNSIKGIFRVANSGTYDESRDGIMKRVIISLDPNEQEWIPDDKKRKVRNDSKRTLVLNLRGKVDVKK